MKYSKLVESKIEYLEKQISQIKELNDTVIFVQNLMPDAHLWLDHEVNVNWPAKSMNDVKAVLKLFAENKCMLKSVNNNPTNPSWILGYKGKTIRLAPEWLKDESEAAAGATCRLVKVGESTTTYPIYKLVCDDKMEVAEDGSMQE